MRVLQFIIPFSLFLPLFSNHSEAQTDEIGSGKSLQMDGIDDYVDLGNVYDDLKFPITISSWVYINESVTDWAPVFISQDNASVYNGFWFLIQPTIIAIGYGDGLGEDNPAFRRGKAASFQSIANRWTNLTGIIRGATDMELYINGINVGGNYSGFTDGPMSSLPTDVAKIGRWFSNGQTFHFKGKLDEIRLWNRNLTPDEIRFSMCRTLIGNESGLIGYWNFNELNGATIKDSSIKAVNGIIKGNPTRFFSGAPMGESSVTEYRSNWSNFSIEIADGEDKITVSNIKNIPEGIHLYKVESKPSQLAGLDGSLPNKPYFGVFIAGLDNDNLFDLTYFYQGKEACKAYARSDNSSPVWSIVDHPVKNKPMRGEFIKASGSPISLELGNDKVVCNIVDITLDTKITDPLVSVLWSGGQITSSIKVDKPGKYWVRVSNSCGIISDTVRVKLVLPPPSFSFGDDKVVCDLDPVLLKPYPNPSGYQFTWHDNSIGDSFMVKELGIYSVKVKNECGEATDVISFSSEYFELDSIPNVITPNGDPHNEHFVIADGSYGDVSLLVVNRWGKQVYFSSSYNNDWNGEDLSPGVYFYKVTGPCIKPTKGSLTIVR